MMYLDMLSFNLSCIGFPRLSDMSFNCFQKFLAIIFPIPLLPYFLFLLGFQLHTFPFIFVPSFMLFSVYAVPLVSP